MKSQHDSVDEGIVGLCREISRLREELAATAKDRDNQIDRVKSLRDENSSLKAKLRGENQDQSETNCCNHDCARFAPETAIEDIISDNEAIAFCLLDVSHFCPKCNEECPTEESLQFHRSLCRKKSRLRCEECPYTTSHTGRMNQHIKDVHKKNKSHKCEHCGKDFARKSTLKMHITSVHIRDKKYNCVHCSYSATRQVLQRMFLQEMLGPSLRLLPPYPLTQQD